MGKLILTQEQVESLELTLKKANGRKSLALRWIGSALIQKKRLSTDFSALKELSVGKVARALYFGYEIKKEFKAGDWVFLNEFNKVAKVVDPSSAGGIRVDDNVFVRFKNCRHATPEEIEKEEGRRWWGDKNRNAWELKPQDILKHKIDNKLSEVKEIRKSEYLIGDLTSYQSKEDVEENYTIVCLAENRLDRMNEK